MADYQSQLVSIFEEVYNAPTDNQRYHANETALQLLTEALAEANSFRWQWDFAGKISVLTAPDKKFRIFTWPVVNDAGEYECFGVVQAFNEQVGGHRQPTGGDADPRQVVRSCLPRARHHQL